MNTPSTLSGSQFSSYMSHSSIKVNFIHGRRSLQVTFIYQSEFHPWKMILQVTFIHQSEFHPWKINLQVRFIHQSEFHQWKIILWVTFIHQSTFHPWNFILLLHIHRSDFILFTCVNSLLKKSSLSILRDSSFIIWVPFIHQSTFIHGTPFIASHSWLKIHIYTLESILF
jgi:hypothetical protein